MPLGSEERTDSARPSVSVVVTVFNGVGFVGDCIASVLAQTYRPFEIVIADDDSSDASLEVVERFDDSRIRVLPPAGARLGVHGNWQRAYAAATGTYLKHVCHDDLLEERCLERQVGLLEAHPEAAFACGRRRIIDDRGRVVIAARGIGALADKGMSRVVPASELARACVRAGTNLLGEPASVLLRRSRLPCPMFDPRWTYTVDLEFALRVAACSAAVVDDGVVASFRVSPSQLSALLVGSQARELRALFRELRRRHPEAVSWRDIAEGDVRSLVHAAGRRAFYGVLGLRRSLATHGRARQ